MSRNLSDMGIIVIIGLALAACAPTMHAPAPAAAGKSGQVQTPVSEMDTGFLYLAAERAVRNGRPVLAIRFLEALVKKDAAAVKPRIQLAELLLQSGHVTEAERHMEALLRKHGLPPETTKKIQMLHAQLLATSGKKVDAIMVLQSMLKNSPDSYSVRLMLISFMAQEGRFSEAHKIIREGIKAGAHPQLYHIDAELYIRQGKLEEAKKSLYAMHKLMPDQPESILVLSRLAMRQGDALEAEEILRAFLARHPEALSVSNALGRLLVQQGRGKEAIAVYEDISHRTGGHPEVLTALGLLYYQQKDYGSAAASFRKALTMRPANQARFYLAASLEAMGKNTEAARIYRRIKRDTASYMEAQLRLAAMDLQANRIEAALLRLRALIKEKPEIENAYAMLSAALLRQKKYRQLLKETEPAMGLARVSLPLLFNRAAAYEGLKQYEKAVVQLKRLFTIEPGNIEALNFLGYIYAEQGVHLNEAEGLIRRALKRKPGNGYYLDSLAWVHYKRGEYAKALGLQQKAVRKIPDDPVMQEHLGDILWRAGKAGAARSAWKKAIRLGHEGDSRLQNKINKGL